MNIHCCSVTDGRYLVPTMVTIGSVCLNNIQYKIDYWLIVDKITDHEKDLLSRFEKKFSNLCLHIIEFTVNDLPSSCCEAITKTLKDTRLTPSSYGRLFIAELLLKNVTKVLYLDGDVLCTKSLEELFNLNMKKNAVAAVLDAGLVEPSHVSKLGISNYVNSGVLLINLQLWRDQDTTKLFSNCIMNNYRELKYHDQDTLNIVLRDLILILPKIFNYQIQPEPYGKKKRDGIYTSAYFLHFITRHKPWVKGACNPLKQIWFSYYEKIFDNNFSYLESFDLTTRIILRIRWFSYYLAPLKSRRRNFIKKMIPASFKAIFQERYFRTKDLK